LTLSSSTVRASSTSKLSSVKSALPPSIAVLSQPATIFDERLTGLKLVASSSLFAFLAFLLVSLISPKLSLA
jgi:hypothetical protein